MSKSKTRPLKGDKLFEVELEHNRNSDYEWMQKTYWWGKNHKQVQKFVEEVLRNSCWKWNKDMECWEADDGWNLLSIGEVKEFEYVYVENGTKAWLKTDWEYMKKMKEMLENMEIIRNAAGSG